jgi:hypothetical protein
VKPTSRKYKTLLTFPNPSEQLLSTVQYNRPVPKLLVVAKGSNVEEVSHVCVLCDITAHPRPVATVATCTVIYIYIYIMTILKLTQHENNRTVLQTIRNIISALDINN